MSSFAFSQLDVFTTAPFTGNPLAVVHDGGELSTAVMQRFAQWTDLSETAFLLAPTQPGADYRVRIFTPDRELPFAGHPTLGSAHAWLAAHRDHGADTVVQECGVGLVPVRRTASGLAFAAPPLIRSGPVDATLRSELAGVLDVAESAIRDAAWVANGPNWVAVLLADAQAVLDVEPGSSPTTWALSARILPGPSTRSRYGPSSGGTA